MSLGPLSTIVYDKFNGDYSVWQKDFISRVKKVYPGATDLYKHLENNDEIEIDYNNKINADNVTEFICKINL